MNITHQPVLLKESIEALTPAFEKTYVDATLGAGGHAKELCACLNETNRLIGIDQDPIALAKAAETLKDCKAEKSLIEGNFGNLTELLYGINCKEITGGILMDLGMSNLQIKDRERGFSFTEDAPPDMRMSPKTEQTAAELLNTLDEKTLADIFYNNADERLSRPIARAIIAARPIESTKQLAQIAYNIYKGKGVKAQNIHPATRIFQALRMEVNRETEMLKSCLLQLPNLLTPGARVAIITFHSIEDKIVKHFFRDQSTQCLCPPHQPICTCTHTPAFKSIGKPITATGQEKIQNPQSRSAKLRVAEKK